MNSTPAPTVQGESESAACPFCGSTNISSGEVLTSSGVKGGVNAVTQSQCMECGAVGPEAELAEGDADYGCVKSIAAWNRRAALSTREQTDARADIHRKLAVYAGTIFHFGLNSATPERDDLIATIDAALNAKEPT